MSKSTSDNLPLRVLIAEDETLIRLDLRGMLEDHGLVVCGEARDGSAVRAAVARHSELLAARRVVGSSADSIEIDLPSPSGQLWPLRVHLLADGSVDVSVAAGRGEAGTS